MLQLTIMFIINQFDKYFLDYLVVWPKIVEIPVKMPLSPI